jgi:tRNA G26 N,N-dimethylase Trm1
VALVAAMKAVLEVRPTLLGSHSLRCPGWRVFPPSFKTEFEQPFKQFVGAADICVRSLSVGRINELGYLIPSSRREKTKEPEFGIYHYSTSVASILYTVEGETVLDPFGGSGITMKVARNLKRNSFLHKINSEYIDLIKENVGWNSSLDSHTRYEIKIRKSITS